MKLLYQSHSPYARKVLVLVHEAGLAGRVEVVHHETSPTLRNETVYAQNPLGKVPVLIRQDGDALFDSDVICAYLDTLHARSRFIPEAGETRWRALRLQAMAQGLCESGIALRWEQVRRPPAYRYLPLQEGHAAKLRSAYDWLEPRLSAQDEVTIGHIAVATALSWIEFRGLPDFRGGRPALAAWMNAFSDRPSMQATPLGGDTHD